MLRDSGIKLTAAAFCAVNLLSGCVLQSGDTGANSSSLFSNLSAFFQTDSDTSSEISSSKAPSADSKSVSSSAATQSKEVTPGGDATLPPVLEPGPTLTLKLPEPRPAPVLVRPNGTTQGQTTVIDKSIEAMPRSGRPSALAAQYKGGQHDDVWFRIRANLSISGVIREEVVSHLVWLKKNPRYFEKISARATPYLYYIAKRVEERRMPSEMALVPIVESGFQPFAYSNSGAAGLWQIIPSTGRHLGLKQNWWYDGRRDVIQATDAALTYLSRLHKQFKDWALAFAAYNAGKGTVRRAQQKNKAKGKGTDFWAIRHLLPRETRGYVPRLLAIAAAVRNPAQFGIKLAPIANTPYFKQVDFDSQVDIGLAAKAANVSLRQLQRLNPGFKRWATDPDGPHRLLVPVHAAKRMQVAMAKIPPEQRVTWRVHRIQTGETLGQIARNYGTRVDVLKKVNKLKSSSIRAGKTLVVPAHTGADADIAIAAARAGVGTTANRSSKKTTKARVSADGNWHVVRAGESLWTIARKHNTRVVEIARANALPKNAILRPGQRMLIPLPAKGDKSIRVAATLERSVHTVRSGESLWTIARKVGVKVDQLRAWNALERGAVLRPGQKLYLSPDKQPRSS